MTAFFVGVEQQANPDLRGNIRRNNYCCLKTKGKAVCDAGEGLVNNALQWCINVHDFKLLSCSPV
jgi:hypothetical protein